MICTIAASLALSLLAPLAGMRLHLWWEGRRMAVERRKLRLTAEQAALVAEAKQLALQELWRRRKVWPLLEHYLDRDQLADMRSFFESGDADAGKLPSADWCDDISRQRGKSYKWTVFAVVWCHCHPHQQVKYLAQFGTSVRGIVAPTIDALIEDMPPECRPRYDGPDAVRVDKQDHKWHFPHNYLGRLGMKWSTLHAAGANNKHYRALRGPRAHILIKDECAFYDEFTEAEEALNPMLITTKGISVYATTPPTTTDHPYKVTRDSLKATGRYSHRTIHEHPRLSPAEVEAVLTKEAEKRKLTLQQFRRTTFYRREYLCQHVVEESRAVVPEWSGVVDEENPEAGIHGDTLILEDDALPDFFLPLDSLDLGFTRDPHGYIYGYWDFLRSTLVIVDELPALFQTRTDELAMRIREVRQKWLLGSNRYPYYGARLYKDGTHWLPFLSVGDAGGNGAEKLDELRKSYEMDFSHAVKTDVESMANALRQLVHAGKFRIHRRCGILRGQLESGLWADTKKSDFQRTSAGHLDHLAALIYLVAKLEAYRSRNPYPPHWNVDLANSVVSRPNTGDSENVRKLRRVFG